MKRWLFITMVLWGAFFLVRSAAAATYNATGIWTYSTSGNWVNPGNAYCAKDPDETNQVATVTQKGDWVSIYVKGFTATGSVNGAYYTVSTSYPQEYGTTTVTVNFTLVSSGYGSGTISWSYSDPYGYYCNGGGNITMTKQDAAPFYDASAINGVWQYTTSSPWSDCGSPDSPDSAFTKIVQNGNTFTYVDAQGVHTGRVSGKNYIAVISYYDENGITTETLFVTLSSSTYGTGTVSWTWTDGWETCGGGNNITISKQPAQATYNATGIWSYSTGNHWNNCGDPNISVSGNLSLTQDGTSFRMNYKGTNDGLVSGTNYICQVSYPDEGGTTIESIYFKLTSSSSGSGSVVWYWTDGTQGCWGGNNLTIAKTGVLNQRPNPPLLSSPGNGSINVSLTPTLETGAFSDPDANAVHEQTEWEISKSSNFSTTVLSTVSSSRLTALIVPKFVLVPGTIYYWRARFYDEKHTASVWSNGYSFTTLTATNDQNGDGIPDNQEVGIGVDLDNNGIPDINQNNIKSLNTVVGNAQMGVSRNVDPTVIAIGSIESIDPASVSNIARPYLPLGLFGMELRVVKPLDGGEVTIYFSDPAPAGLIWYVHNSIQGWVDYSKQAVFSADRKSVKLKLMDAGYGDSDGLFNGTIVDPSGPGITSYIKGLVSDAETAAEISGAEITIDGLTIKPVVGGNYQNVIIPGTYTMTITASGYEPMTIPGVEIPVGGTVNKNITLNPIKPTVEIPVFSPPQGIFFTKPQSVSMTCATAGATIRYTLDGSDPNEASAVYGTPIQVSVTTRIRARAYKTDMEPSETASGLYTIAGTRGDVSGDGPADLKDVILILRNLCGMAVSAESMALSADVNGDARIGLAEAIYVLQKSAGLKD